jgi:hypothetical protein
MFARARSRLTAYRGRSVTAFGVLFDFAGSAVNTTVQRVEDMIHEPWVRLIPYSFHLLPHIISQFIDAITDEPDVFLLVG